MTQSWVTVVQVCKSPLASPAFAFSAWTTEPEGLGRRSNGGKRSDHEHETVCHTADCSLQATGPGAYPSQILFEGEYIHAPTCGSGRSRQDVSSRIKDLIRMSSGRGDILGKGRHCTVSSHLPARISVFFSVFIPQCHCGIVRGIRTRSDDPGLAAEKEVSSRFPAGSNRWRSV